MSWKHSYSTKWSDDLMIAWRKLYDFFICHHKAATGCMARLINIDFNARGKKVWNLCCICAITSRSSSLLVV
eukprot:2958791-Amphidinium_carterae.1